MLCNERDFGNLSMDALGGSLENDLVGPRELHLEHARSPSQDFVGINKHHVKITVRRSDLEVMFGDFLEPNIVSIACLHINVAHLKERNVGSKILSDSIAYFSRERRTLVQGRC